MLVALLGCSRVWAQDGISSIGLNQDGIWVITLRVDGGVVVAVPELPERLHTDEDRRLDERMVNEWLPQLLVAADGGVQPARWLSGMFFLRGWYKVPVDVTTAERTLWTAPAEKHRVVAYALGEQAFAADDDARAERLLTEALDAGVLPAARGLCWRARSLARKEAAHAEQLLSMALPLRDDDPNCQLAMAEVRTQQERFDEAYRYAVKTEAVATPGDKKTQSKAWWLRVQSGLKSGELSKLEANELRDLLFRPIDMVAPRFRLLMWGVPLVGLLVLLWRVWAGRAKAMGFWFAWLWSGVPAYFDGLGFLIPPVSGPLGWWGGTVVSALACLAALRFRSVPTPYGNVTRPIERRMLLLAGSMLVATLSVEFAWSSIRLALFGSAPLEQLVASLMRVKGPVDSFWTLLFVAGLVPWVEEVCFRGFLYEGIEGRWGTKAAVLGSSAIFGLAHLDPTSPVTHVLMTGMIGLLLAELRRRSGDLRLGVLLHSANNALAVLLLSFS